MTRIFMSYSHQDGERIAEFLHERLTGCGYDVWKDTHDLPLGRNFPRAISDAVQVSTDFIVLLTKASLQSDWVGDEIDMAMKARCKVLPIVVDEISDAEIPLYLSKINYMPIKGMEDWQALHRLVDALDGGKDIPRVYSMSKQTDTKFDGVLLLKKSEWSIASPKEPGEIREVAEKMWRDFLDCWKRVSNLGLVPPGYAPIATTILALLAGKPNHLPRLYYPYPGPDQKFRISADKFVELQRLRMLAQSE